MKTKKFAAALLFAAFLLQFGTAFASADPSAETSAEPTTEPVVVTETEEETAEEEPADTGLTDAQINSITMLNYLTYLTQQIYASSNSRLYLEQVYSELINNTYPNAVDKTTQLELEDILDTLEDYRMLDVKRERLEYIYDQNRAQAIWKAMPSGMSVLSVVQSKNWIAAVFAGLNMAVSSVTSYATYMNEIDQEYLQDGWDLDDAEAATLHSSRSGMFSYMISIVNDNNLPGDLALSESQVTDFVDIQNNTNVVSRIRALESAQETYQAFGPYWLTLAESYYENGDYAECLASVAEYESHTSRIFRKDTEYAAVLPMAIYAASETMTDEEYIEAASDYAEKIMANCDADDWVLHYFAAMTYLDLYERSGDTAYLQTCYDISLDNVNALADEQRSQNAAYLADVQKVDTADLKGDDKDEAKDYNDMLTEERKIALPPVYEPLILNCELLFAAAQELDITQEQADVINGILHENGDPIFLSETMDTLYYYGEEPVYAEDVEIAFDGDTIEIPANYVNEGAVVTVAVTGDNGTTVFDDWTVKSVERNNSYDAADFTVKFKSKLAGDYTFADGDQITVTICYREDAENGTLVFTYEPAVTERWWILPDGVNFVRTDG